MSEYQLGKLAKRYNSNGKIIIVKLGNKLI